MSDYEEIRKALTHLDANDRDFWVRMGAAVKDELGEDGFELWDEWSRQSDTYKPNDAKAVWKSLKQGHIHIGTLFYHARENGYRPDKPYTLPSAEELAKRAQAAQEKQRAEAERIAKDHAKAAKTAYGIWKNASPADPNHAYAKNKGLGLSEAAMNAIRQNEYNGKKQLIIPLYSDKKLVNVQTIDEDGNKSFLSGGQKQGAYTVIGDFRQHQNGVILAEGFATAASVHQATGKPVIAAFDAGNLKAVSEKLVNVLPENVPVYFAADNDPKETGLVKAQAAAQIWGERAQIAMPTFSAKQIDEYQAEHGKFDSHGNENVPTDFNDLHKLAGIEAVREQLNTMITPEIRQPEMTEPQEIRTAWNDFPPVISNGRLGDLKNEPEYSAAKAGDMVQSALLVDKLLKDETVQELKNLIGDNQPILVPIQSEEASGKNLIPRTTAEVLAAKLNLQVDENIYQSNTAKRTNSGIYHRYVSPPEFKGEVQAGKSYLIVDDTLSVGGTIAALKGYIENNGGQVIGSTVMTAHELKVNIAIQPNMLQSLQQKQGLNEYWRNEFGYGVDKLTQQEAGHLRKPTLEQIQERVEQAKLDKQNAHLSENKELNHEQTTQTQSFEAQMSGVSNLSDGAASRGVETAPSGSREISQSIFQQPQPPRSEEVNPPTPTAASINDVAVSISNQEENIMENLNIEPSESSLKDYVKPELPREELLQNNYWRVQNGYDPLPENDQQPEQTTYSADNPYAQWAEHDDEVRHNADSWEMRTPLTNERLAHFNQQAEQYGFTTRIESSSGELGVFQADKWVNETYHVEIDGQFKNHGSMATYEAAHDFTMSFHENDEIVHYVYTNHLDDALQQANDFLQNPAEWIKEQDLKMQAEAMQPENAPPEYDYMPEYSSDDNELPPYYPPEYFEQLSTEPPTATSEKDVAVSVSEQEEQPEKIVSEYAKQMISELSQQHGWTQGGEDRAYKNVDDERTLVAYANEQYLTLGENDVDGGRDIVYSVDTQQTSPQLAADVFNQYADRYAQGEHIRPQDVEIALQQRNQSVQPAPETTIPEPPQRRQPESELAQPTATSEKDVAVPVSEQQETTPEIQTEQQPEMFNGIEYGGFQREIRLPEKQPESQPEPQTEPATEPVQPTPPTAEKVQPAPQPDVEEPELSRPETLEQPQPILDLAYEKPPKHLQSRYIVAENGQYLSADNHTTVLFEDKGNALKTAKSDQQTIQDMLEVAKAKGWDSIKISGSPEFKSQMYVAAESQGIKTSGYKPTPADLAMVAKLREDRSLNGIQSTHKPELDPKQPENAPTHQPDAATLSAADKLKTQSAMPNERQINSSPIADTEEAPKISSLGSKTIPSEVLRSTYEMTAAALSPEVETAKSAYDQKAKQLSEPNQARLKAYERNTMDALRDVQGDARNHALRNFYEHTTKVMNGTELNLPQPLQHQAPAQQQTHEPKPSNSQEFEMER